MTSTSIKSQIRQKIERTSKKENNPEKEGKAS